MPCGFKAALPVLTMLGRYLHKRGLTAKVTGVEAVFAQQTHET
jgi:hypothetical protein